MKNARERMDVLAAYREVGSYRGAAELCGTTHKTGKRIVERHDAGAPCTLRTGRLRYSPRCNGRSSSNAGVPMMCGPSWPRPAPFRCLARPGRP